MAGLERTGCKVIGNLHGEWQPPAQADLPIEHADGFSWRHAELAQHLLGLLLGGGLNSGMNDGGLAHVQSVAQLQHTVQPGVLLPGRGFSYNAAMTIRTHEFSNGLVLAVEPIPGVASVGMTLLLPAGAVTEPHDRQGIGAVLGEMVMRGAGDLDARAHADALDLLGVHRSAESHSQHFRLGATFLGDRLPQALPLLFDMVRRPHMSEKDFGPAVQLALQSIESLEDEPQEKVMLELRRLHLGDPLGRSNLGRPDDLRAMQLKDALNFIAGRFVAGGAILGLAGAVEFEHARDLVGELLGDMAGAAHPIDEDVMRNAPGSYHHLHADSHQQHIGLAYETIGEAHELSMTQRLAVAVLSGGMSGRLFTEVREVRGLCYAVYASYAPRRSAGTIYAYSGTTTQRAAQTLDVLTAELRRLSDGVTADEFQRAVVGLKTRLIMQGESTGARARAIAYDQFLLGRPRTLAERAAEIDAVALADLNEFLVARPAQNFTTLTIGPEPLMQVSQV